MAVFSTVGNIISAKSNRKAAKRAAQVSADNNAANNALAREVFADTKESLAPAVNALAPSISLMEGAMGYGDQDAYRNAFSNFIQNSDYGFQFGEGANALNSGYAGAGLLQSGDAMKGLEGFRQNLQSGYRGEFNNMLANQQSLGLAGASALAGVSQGYQNTVTNNNNLNASNAANAALVRGANNPWGAGLNNYGNVLQQAVGFGMGGGF